MELLPFLPVIAAQAAEDSMFKWAVLFLVISLIAGALGFANISTFARRVAFVLFGLFFLGFLALLGFAYLLGQAFDAGASAMAIGALLAA
jgi:uncharacterized membrane protein YtjA (UPF0391 family)